MRCISILASILFLVPLPISARQAGIERLEEIESSVLVYREENGLPDGPISAQDFDALFGAVMSEFSTIWVAGSNKIMLCLNESLSYLDQFGVSSHAELPRDYQEKALAISALSDRFGPGGGKGHEPDSRLSALTLLLVVDAMKVPSPQMEAAMAEFREAKAALLRAYAEGMGQRYAALISLDCTDHDLGAEISAFRSERDAFADLVGKRLEKTIPAIMGGSN